MKLIIPSYLARVSWFRRKNHKKKIRNKTIASYKVEFYAFLFCCRDCCKVVNSGITNLLRKHLCLKYFGKYYTTLNQKLWWMSFTASQHMHVSGPIQIYKSNKARRSVLWKVYAFFYQQNKDRKQKLLSISWQFANVTLAYVTDFWVSRGHTTLWWLEILTKQIQNRSQRFWMHFNSAFSPWRKLFYHCGNGVSSSDDSFSSKLRSQWFRW